MLNALASSIYRPIKTVYDYLKGKTFGIPSIQASALFAPTDKALELKTEIQDSWRLDVEKSTKIYKTFDIFVGELPVNGLNGVVDALTNRFRQQLIDAAKAMAATSMKKITVESLILFRFAENINANAKEFTVTRRPCYSTPMIVRPTDSLAEIAHVIDSAIEEIKDVVYKRQQGLAGSAVAMYAEVLQHLRIASFLYRAHGGGAGDYNHPGCVSLFSLSDPKHFIQEKYASWCGPWSIAHNMHFSSYKNSARPRQYVKHIEELKLAGINPQHMTVEDLPKIELMNDIRINALAFCPWLENRDQVYPLFTSSQTKAFLSVNLMLCFDKETREAKHWLSVTNLSIALHKHLIEYDSNGDVSKSVVGKKLFCPTCHRRFLGNSPGSSRKDGTTPEQIFEEHCRMCTTENPGCQTVKMPCPRSFKFKHTSRTRKVLYVAHMVFDIVINKKDGIEEPGAAAVVIIDDSNTVCFEKKYKSIECAVVALLEWHNKAFLRLHRAELPMNPMTGSQQQAYAAQDCCPFCQRTFSLSIKKVQDHDHKTGEFRQALCRECNIDYTDRRLRLPIYVTDFEARSPHVLAALKNIAPYDKKVTVRGSDGPGRVRVLSVQNGVPDKRAGQEEENEEDVITRKTGIFGGVDFMAPESYFSFDDSGDIDILIECQNFAKKMTKTRSSLRKSFGLDPAFYPCGAPSFAESAMLYERFTSTGYRNPIDLCADPEHYTFAERAQRGGTCCANAQRTAENNMNHIFALDATSLYPSQMMGCLPSGGYRFEHKLPTIEAIMRIDPQGNRGMLIEIDGHFPDKLHDKLSDFPPMPEHRVVERHELSPTSQEDAPVEFKKARSQLLMSLHPKKDYVIELSHLQECVNLGFVVTRISRALSFDQSPWLKPFIEKCVKLRQGAKTDEDDRLYKLVMNSLAGRMQLNVRKHDDTRAVRTVCCDDFSSSHFRGFHSVYGDPNDSSVNSLHLLTSRRPNIVLSAPIVVGVCILEKAKMWNLKLWYDGIRSVWDNARLLYHDTDSFFVEVVVYGCRANTILSLKCVPYVDGAQSKKPGLLKIEAQRIAEFICFGKKMYSALLDSGIQKAGTAGLSVTPEHDLFRKRVTSTTSTASSLEVMTDVSRIVRANGISGASVCTREELRCFAGNVEASRFWLPGRNRSFALGHHYYSIKK
jgi:hypothetical protein